MPICAASFALTYCVVPRMPYDKPSRQFDWPRQLLSILALLSFVGTVIEVHASGMTSTTVRYGFLFSFIAGAAFLFVENRVRAPMLPLMPFCNARFSGAVVFGVLANFTYYGVVFLLSFYLQEVRCYSVFRAGLTFLPLTGTAIISNVAAGRLSPLIGLRPLMVVGSLLGRSRCRSARRKNSTLTRRITPSSHRT